ncbi:hypothetical protein ACHAXR_008758 [Thalassiosira sp. AJA248-18]
MAKDASSLRPTKSAMDPPAEREPKYPYPYALGDVGKSEHMNVFQTQEGYLLAVTRLKPNDPCFVLRSDGGYTFAKVLAHQDRSGHLEIQVNDKGSTKTIPMYGCANKYIRTVRLHTPPSFPRQPKIRPRLQRRSSETFSSACTQRLKRQSSHSSSFRLRPACGRHSSHNASFQSGLDTPQAQIRLGCSNSLRSSILTHIPNQAEETHRRSSCSISNELEDLLPNIELSSPEEVDASMGLQLGLSDLRSTSAHGRQSSPNASFRSDLGTPQAQRRPSHSSRSGSLRSSSITQAEDTRCSSCTMSNELEDILPDIELGSPEGVESDLEVISEPADNDTEHGLGCYSPDEGYQRSAAPIMNMEVSVMGSVKTVALPGEFDNIQFNQASLIKAFSSIVLRTAGVCERV